MKIKKAASLFLVFNLLLLTFSCSNSKKNILTENQMEITGVIEKQGMTTYQYGTHVIQENNVLYALKSSKIDLNTYLNKKVTIIARKIEGYPISGGPLYLSVEKVK